MSANSTELPLTGIATPQDLDILCGRGGTAFRHRGNQIYRDLVNRNKEFYSMCPKSEKPKIARSIVVAIRERNGRFLEQDVATNTWFDIGDKKAIEKTSQALREGQSKRRQQIIQGSETGGVATPAGGSGTGAIPSPGICVVPPPVSSAAAAAAAPLHASIKAPPPPEPWQPPPPPVGGVEQQHQPPSFLMDDDAVLQHLDSVMNLSIQDDDNNEQASKASGSGLQMSHPPPPAQLEPQDSRFSAMSGFSSFGTSAMSLGSIGTVQTLEDNMPSRTLEDNTSSNPTFAAAAANAAASTRRGDSGRQLDVEDDDMPAIYMVESSSTLSSNVSGMSGYPKQNIRQQQYQQQLWSTGVAPIPHAAASTSAGGHHQPLPAVLESAGFLHNHSSASTTSDICVMRPDSMLTDDFYQQAKQVMMKSSTGGGGGGNISSSNDHVNNKSMGVVVPPVPPFHHHQEDKHSSLSSSQQQQRHLPGMHGAILESSLSLHSNMSAISMNTLQTNTTGHQSNNSIHNNINKVQPWRRMPTSATAGQQQQQQAVAEEEYDQVDNNDKTFTNNMSTTSLFSFGDGASIMSGMSKVSISDKSLEEAANLFSI